MKNFNECKTSVSSSLILTQIVSDICRTKSRSLWTHEKCSGLKIQPKEFVYTFSSENSNLSNPTQVNVALQLAQNSTLIRISDDGNEEEIEANNLYQTIAHKSCPQVYDDSMNTF